MPIWKRPSISRIFVDTSALFALLVASDANHSKATRVFRVLETREARLLTSSYVLVESYALLLHRIGLKAVRDFRGDFAPLLDIVWVDSEMHEAGMDLLMERRSRRISLVDAVSFHVMRSERIDEVFAYDRHFGQEGFTLIA